MAMMITTTIAPKLNTAPGPTWRVKNETIVCERVCHRAIDSVSPLFCYRPIRRDQRLVASNEGQNIFISHSLRHIARENGAITTAAVHDDFRIGVGKKFFDIALEHA